PVLVVVSTEALSACAPSRNGIELSSSVDSENRTAACPRESVIYTCTVPNTGVLQWAVESFHTFESNSIILSVQHDPVGTVVEEEEGLIIANVTNVVPNMIYLGQITSTLTLLAHENFHNKTVWCGNGASDETESACILHHYGVAPSSPLSPIYTTTHHDIETFTVLLEWTRPQSDGGLGISNYTTTLRSLYSLHTHVGRRNNLYLTLLYNQMYIMQITATNCGGMGPPANITNIYSVSCGLPDLLSANASNQEITAISTHEGSQVKFVCADDEEIVLKCSSNSSWTPDASEIKCSNIILSDAAHCSAPMLPQDSHIDKERSVLGSVLIYQCDRGYVPTELMVSKCSSSGEWTPNVTELECTKQVNCEIPVAPLGGTLHHTGTERGSKAVIECSGGLELQGNDVNRVAVCTANGTWFPDPSSQRCFETETYFSNNKREDAVYLYLITGGAVFLVSLPLGMLLSCLYSQYQKRRANHRNKQLPTYEEVKVKDPRKNKQKLLML
ncbi:Sushi, von Willebrand factor type A, EGF and pentraxin domain-containing protein 1, partial [Geodia barretti]